MKCAFLRVETNLAMLKNEEHPRMMKRNWL